MAPSFVTIGRGTECTVMLEDPTVSSQHARLTFQPDGTILIEDLGSANGTFVRGRVVRAAVIHPGEDVRLGSVPLKWSHPELREFVREGRRRARGGSALVRVARVVGLFALGVLAATGLALIIALAFPGGRDTIRAIGDQVRGTVGR